MIVDILKLALPVALALALAPNVSAEHAAVQLVVAATPHDADATSTDVRAITLDTGATRTLATLRHPPGAVIRGDVRGGESFVVMDEDNGDRFWGAGLYRVDGAGARRLAGGIGHARRPLASVDGWVYVERGTGGNAVPDAHAGQLRMDDIHIDAIDAATGAIRAVYGFSGYALHLAGEHAGALIVYRVGAHGTDIISVDRASGALRASLSVAPFARDFSVDDATGSLVFADRDSGAWTIDRLDLSTFSLSHVASDVDQQSSPLALPSGAMAMTAPRRGGLSLGGRVLTPLGVGFDAPLVSTDDGTWLSVLHVPASGFDETYAIDVARGTGARVGSSNERVDTLGFLGNRNGGAR